MTGTLVAYAGMVRELAREQLEGRLSISPRAVFAASEPLTEDTRAKAQAAWGVDPFDVYGATETSGIASECSVRHGMHLYEDLVITESVDDQNKPVPSGTAGAKILVTVLFSRTLPLIRYEMTDSIALAGEPCSCGLPFGLISSIEGRSEDRITLPAAGGGIVEIHPNVFHNALEAEPLAFWQVVQESERLRIRAAWHDDGSLEARVKMRVNEALSAAGATATHVIVERVERQDRTPIGKQKLIVAMKKVK